MSKSALREFNTAFMQNLVTKKSSSSPKKNSSGVISSRSESDTIISEWYEKNKKGLACACSKQQFKQIKTLHVKLTKLTPPMNGNVEKVSVEIKDES